MKPDQRLLARGAWVLAAVALVPFGSVLESAAADTPQRYPYDPVCAWGRLADGHGMLIRCLEPAEASQLLQASLRAPAQEKAATPSGAQASPARKPRVTKVGPAVADTGELPLAGKNLTTPSDRYVECVEKNGGLTAEQASVVVRFLVRERGRAEGVGVKSFKGMSEAAAKCIADVVDRRYVGYPAAPVVGATLPIEMSGKN